MDKSQLIYDERVAVFIDAGYGIHRTDDRVDIWYKYDLDSEMFVDILTSRTLCSPLVYWWDGHTCGVICTVAVDSEEEFVKLLEEASGTSL